MSNLFLLKAEREFLSEEILILKASYKKDLQEIKLIDRQGERKLIKRASQHMLEYL